MTAAQPPGHAEVIPLIPAAPNRPPLRLKDFIGAEVGDTDGSGDPVAVLLDVYAHQVDEIDAVVEQWQASLLGDTHRRYATVVLGALGELHVALDAAAELVTQRPDPAADPAVLRPSRRDRAQGAPAAGSRTAPARGAGARRGDG